MAFSDSDNDGIVKNEKPSDNLPQTLEGILAERKRINEESHGKPNKNLLKTVNVIVLIVVIKRILKRNERINI